jgi:hypothetical protein
MLTEWTSVREEWASERERLASAREEWESKVRAVEFNAGLSGLAVLQQRQQVIKIWDFGPEWGWGGCERGSHHHNAKNPGLIDRYGTRRTSR